MTVNKKIQQYGRSRERGNVLFLILIAVALFAALSYVASMSTRGGGKTASEETRSIRTSQITQYATMITQTILRMKFKGVIDEDICFDSDAWGHNDYDHSGCVDPANRVFNNGVSWMTPPEGANDGSDYYFPANVCVPGQGTALTSNCNTDGDSSTEDLVLILPNVTRVVCLELNDKLGNLNPDGEPPVDIDGVLPAGTARFTGSFSDGQKIDADGSSVDLLKFKQSACIEDGAGTGIYHFYHVIMPR